MFVGCGSDDPVGPEEESGLENKVWIDSISVDAQSHFAINVYVENKQPLNGVVIPLKYISENLEIDSIVFTGSRFEEFELKNKYNYPQDLIFVASVFPDGTELIDTASGLFCKIYFWAKGNAPTQDVLLDTTAALITAKFGFIDEDYNQFAPDFYPGLIQIEALPTASR